MLRCVMSYVGWCIQLRIDLKPIYTSGLFATSNEVRGTQLFAMGCQRYETQFILNFPCVALSRDCLCQTRLDVFARISDAHVITVLSFALYARGLFNYCSLADSSDRDRKCCRHVTRLLCPEMPEGYL